MKNKSLIDDPRRKFLEKAGKAAALAPAVGLLLAADMKLAQANPYAPTPVAPTPVALPPTPPVAPTP